MLRPSIQDVVARHCANMLWDEGATKVCAGVYQTPKERVVALIAPAGISPVVLEAARKCLFIDQVAVVASRGAAVRVEGPSGLLFPDEWSKMVVELHQGLGDLVSVLLNCEVWACDSNVELASLMLGSPQIRLAMAERYGEDVGEAHLRQLLEDNGSPFPSVLDELLDARVNAVTGGAA